MDGLVLGRRGLTVDFWGQKETLRPLLRGGNRVNWLYFNALAWSDPIQIFKADCTHWWRHYPDEKEGYCFEARYRTVVVPLRIGLLILCPILMISGFRRSRKKEGK